MLNVSLPFSGVVLAVLLLPSTGMATPIVLSGSWYEFGHSLYGTQGCRPADPLGAICVRPSSDPAQPAPAPPWTFIVPPEGAVLTVTDIADYGDWFNVFDFGALLGSTSDVPAAHELPTGGCGYEPSVCLIDPLSSSGVFLLGAGPHELTIIPRHPPAAGGAAHFRIRAVPEPSSLVMLLGGLCFLAGRARCATSQGAGAASAARVAQLSAEPLDSVSASQGRRPRESTAQRREG
jgi:hypothetical protein